MTQSDFLQAIESFISAHRMNATDFGRQFMKDPNFVSRLRKGRSSTMRTVQRVTEGMKEFERKRTKEAIPKIVEVLE
jgi:2,4-dienoyl-CoA reductase-like NADH-dependent reductase (Old Yellow Enzyme family)